MADVVAGAIWVKLGLDATNMASGGALAREELTKWRDGVNTNTTDMAKWGVAIAAQVAPFVAVGKAALDAANAAGEYGDKLHDLSLTTLMSTRNLQSLQYATRASGGDFNSLSTALNYLAKNLQNVEDPTSKQAKALADLGVETLDSTGKIKSMDALFPQIIDKLHNMSDKTKAANLMMELFGKNTGEVAKIVELGADGIEDYTKEMEKLGLMMSDEQLAAQEEFNDQMAELNVQMELLYVQLGTAVLPIFMELLPVFEEMVPVIVAMANAISSLISMLVTLAESAMAAQSAMQGLFTGDYSAAGEHWENAVGSYSRLTGTTNPYATTTTGTSVNQTNNYYQTSFSTEQMASLNKQNNQTLANSVNGIGGI